MTDERSIYILLTNTGTLFTRVIQTYTKAPYNHASISFDRELTELYSFGRKHPSNPLNGGFVKEDIQTGTYSKYPNTTCVIYELQVTEREVEKMKRVLHIFIRVPPEIYVQPAGRSWYYTQGTSRVQQLLFLFTVCSRNPATLRHQTVEQATCTCDTG